MKGWKIQKFASDVVYDLRSRGLLPVAALLVVGIFAAPILIASMGSSDSNVPAGDPAAATEPAPEGQAAVLAYSPGVRNYRKRLDELASKNPFKQQFAGGAEATVAGLGGAVAGSQSGVPAGSSYTGGAGSGESIGGSGGGGSGGGSGGSGGQTYYFYYQTDLNVGESGAELTRRNKVSEFTLLPSDQTPAAVFLGASADGSQAIFSISRSVTSVSGAGVCYPEPDECELLGLEAGEGADLAYSKNGKKYRIEVARIKRVKSSKPQG